MLSNIIINLPLILKAITYMNDPPPKQTTAEFKCTFNLTIVININHLPAGALIYQYSYAFLLTLCNKQIFELAQKPLNQSSHTNLYSLSTFITVIYVFQVHLIRYTKRNYCYTFKVFIRGYALSICLVKYHFKNQKKVIFLGD